MSDPTLLMIAGPNGAGKTTLTQHLVRQGVDLGEYINPDDIAATLQGTLALRSKQAQEIADVQRDACIRAKRSFCFETVMSHPSKIDILVRAKEAGYLVLLYFVGTDDPQTNIDRVALRVAQGGHAVPDNKVRERWFRTMRLLQQAIRSADRAYIFDNSVVGTVETIPRLVFCRSTRNGRLPQSGLIGVPPAWVERFVLNPIGTNVLDDYSSFRRKSGIGSIVTLPVEMAPSESRNALVQATRFVPHSIEAEQRVLGTIMIDNEAFRLISDFLEARHFFEPIHQVIFQATINLVRSGKIAEPGTVRALVPVDVDIGGLTVGQYLNRLGDEAIPLANVHKEARAIYEYSVRRELMRIGNDIATAAESDPIGVTPLELIESANQQLRRLAQPNRTDDGEPSLPFKPPLDLGLHQFSRALVGALDLAARAYVQTGSGIRTGLTDVDRKIVGLQPSELIVIASRPGIGKSALATNIAYNVARSWKKETDKDDVEKAAHGGIVGFFSLEMSSEQVATRIISQQSGIPINVIRSGAISERQFELIRAQTVAFESLPFFIDETTNLSIEQLVARAHRLKTQNGLDLIIVDNLELLRASTRASSGSRSPQITRELKKLAKDLNIPVLVLAQLPSKIDKRHDARPRLEEFNDKGAIEQDADVIIFLHREDFYLFKEEPPFGSYEHENWIAKIDLAFGRAELIIAKQRNGETGAVSLFFDSSVGSFNDLSI